MSHSRVGLTNSCQRRQEAVLLTMRIFGGQSKGSFNTSLACSLKWNNKCIKQHISVGAFPTESNRCRSSAAPCWTTLRTSTQLPCPRMAHSQRSHFGGSLGDWDHHWNILTFYTYGGDEYLFLKILTSCCCYSLSQEVQKIHYRTISWVYTFPSV